MPAPVYPGGPASDVKGEVLKEMPRPVDKDDKTPPAKPDGKDGKDGKETPTKPGTPTDSRE
jgi:hypothetical protein